MQSIETEAKTVEEAIIIACDQLKTTEETLKLRLSKTHQINYSQYFPVKKRK